MNLPLDIYEMMPTAQRSYLANYGWSFNKSACELAVSKMRRRNTATGQTEAMEMKKKDEVEAILQKYNVKLEHNHGYDFVYVYHMGYADYFKSSITDEQHLVQFVKDVIDDTDNYGGNVFRKWYVDCIAKGEPIEWEDLL